ncbi:hypothetical protein GIB67_013217 [Kingdonia uniflora]|uniref:Ribosomal protein L5 n=1 Tax=Kingdonia uniflora TaxID=39325 RepID=A0A7J7NQM7_9MAGN|nr:hypothetical protein GIB67_002733 [Kingdonia uniflora]KAF6156344.1 hypothetical protein GIB67_018562 [Kingdonia uniflora]KAF6162720.1 hypothetical protein GIB67_017368 [Kingdonia uniflora]KAF6169517.1 hypothetical protein GIB67_013217 [Kingdonia uniflora]
MLPLHFHYEEVLRQDLLLKPNHANVLEVPVPFEIRVVPKPNEISTPSPTLNRSEKRTKNVKLAMEIHSGQRFINDRRAPKFLGSSRSNPTSHLMGHGGPGRQSTLRGLLLSHFSVRISTVMSAIDLGDSPVSIRGNSILFSMEREFCELSPELEEHFELFEEMRGFNVTIVTSAKTEDETLPLWSGLLQKDEG